MATRCFSKEGDKDKDAEFEVEDVYKGQTGVLHDKQQSVKEEAFFHKEVSGKGRFVASDGRTELFDLV